VGMHQAAMGEDDVGKDYETRLML